MKYKNLVITQNAKLFQSIRPILICADLDVSQATTYQKALELLSCFHYVLVVADLSFPDIDGIKLIHSLRRLAQVPILAFTSKYTTEEEIQVLFAGADDYLDRGVVSDPERCLAHITAITRRYLWKDRPERAAALIPGNGLKINLKRRRAYFHGENLRLTPKQFIVLQILVERMGEVVTKVLRCLFRYQTNIVHNQSIGNSCCIRIFPCAVKAKHVLLCACRNGDGTASSLSHSASCGIAIRHPPSKIAFFLPSSLLTELRFYDF